MSARTKPITTIIETLAAILQIDLKGVARSKKPDTARAGTADGGEVHPASPTLLHGFIKAVKANSGGSIR